ncbi:amino acid ABC transporter ATP-binding/permease protein [Sphingomonas sp. PAMC 26617]|uniref:amino acid ABC transporter ATP-binding/permease protein n=1 Tax=Sphingomonas sp. PAMC 26617 TaxID=1112216 RepID=UPI0002891DE3|nr:ATP-binding cassette domain-containing protein [Sphingomonas sp. PAMC 26617]
MMPGRLARLLAIAARGHARNLRYAAAGGFAVAAATVLLLGLSGWFLTAAALAAMTGAAHVFNYMLPAVGIRLLAIVRTGARYGERFSAHDAALGMLAEVRPALFGAIAATAPGHAVRFSTGEASARLVQDVAVVEAAVVRRSARWALGGAVSCSALLAVLGGPGVMVAVAGVIAATVGVATLLAWRMRFPAQVALEANGVLKERLADYGAAAPELRCYALEARAVADIERASAALATAQLAGADAASWLDLVQATAIAVAAGVAFTLAIPAGAPIAALAALAAAMGVDGAAPLIRDIAQRASVAAATARLDAILALQPAPAVAVADLSPTAPTIWFRALAAAPFEPGDRVAILGPSGCGKTSLIETLLALRPVERDGIRIGGVDIADITPARLRSLFALAPQDAALLTGTVRDNLMLADPEAEDSRLWQALHDAALDHRVAALPGGLDGWIGENGARLSGGERRRLSLARAFLSRAAWLLLDEPTEGLDPATERRVLDRLGARIATTGQGVLMVTHSRQARAFCSTIAHYGAEQTGNQELASSLPPRAATATR